MEASVLKEPGSTSATLFKDPRAGFLRLQSDERLVSLTRRGNDAAFEALIARYRTRLLAFCRHMVGSAEDAEDILQEVFVSAYRAMLADDRELNVRPWLYRIARNRSLNHLRRPRPTGVDSMDIFEGGAAVATADRVRDRLDLEDLVQDVKHLPETQRTALMLREMGDLSYNQIAEAMDTSIPSVKSLLVRARVSLAEAAESRRLSCEEVRLELGAVAEGLQKLSPPARRHIAACDRCRAFKKEVSLTNRKLAVLTPVGGIVMLKNILALKLFGGSLTGGSSVAGGISAATGAGKAGAGAGLVGGAGAAAGAATGAGAGAIAVKIGAGLAAAALVTGGVTQVAKNGIHSNSIAQRPAVTQPLERDTSNSNGGVSPSAPAPAATGESSDNAPADQAKTTESAPRPVDTPVAPEQKTTSEQPAPVIDEETTTVVIVPGDPSGGGPTQPVDNTTEGPGMPAPPSTAPVTTEPAPTPDSGGHTGGGGATGGTSGSPVTGATAGAPS